MKKFILGIIICIGGIVSFCSADKVENLINLVASGNLTVQNSGGSSSSYLKTFLLYNIDLDYGTYCVKFTNLVNNTHYASYFGLGFSSSSTSNPSNRYNYYFDQVGNTVCLYGNKSYFVITNYNGNSYSSYDFTIDYEIYKLNTLLSTDLPQYTYYTPNGTGIINGNFYVRNIDSNYIYTELRNNSNIIGLDLYFNSNSIDNNYCESNNLCTVCNGGSGEINTGVNRSSVFLNGTQINGNAIIDIYADERMKTEVEYLNDTVDINITTDYDTNYINDVIDKEKLTPTNEDFETYILGLTEFIPYLFIVLLFFVFIKLTKKIRK